MKKRVGLITYHSAYNFGSVLQAFATQEIVKELGCEIEIINYRMKSQYEYYQIFHFEKGVYSFVKNMFSIPLLNKYKVRQKSYENFIRTMQLTEEFHEPDELSKIEQKFDIYLSGSDQIWNKHSNELEKVDWNYMLPYLLSFTKKKKISYASSIVNMKKEELEMIAPYLQDYNQISCREEDSAQRIMGVIDKSCMTVLDPTLLLDKQKWQDRMGKLPNILHGRKYILYYALDGVKGIVSVIPNLKKVAKKRGCVLVIITPLAPIVYGPGIVNMLAAGPREFLRLVNDAELVITNSYHGTLFSVNFEKPFYTIRSRESKDQRIVHVLNLLKLQNRIYNSAEDIEFDEEIDYAEVREILCSERKKSIQYLDDAFNV